VFPEGGNGGAEDALMGGKGGSAGVKGGSAGKRRGGGRRKGLIEDGGSGEETFTSRGA